MNNDRINILVDNESWILPYADELLQRLQELNYEVRLIRNVIDIKPGWINFLLGCTQILTKDYLSLNQHNLVVHESNLPQGRGFAPMTWQILEGKNHIPICLVEAGLEADTGDIWLQDIIILNGTELCSEWRDIQGRKTIDLCLSFVINYPNLSKKKQNGQQSFYARRRATDSIIDPNKSIIEQFNLLRVVDNDRYPAYFHLNQEIYTIKIFKLSSQNSNDE